VKVHEVRKSESKPQCRIGGSDTGIKSLASRDIRLFLIMLGAIIGQAYFCLIIIAALTNLVVLYRLIYIYRHLRQKVDQPAHSSQSSEAP